MGDHKTPKPPKHSGEHRAVVEFRQKLDSIEEFTLPELVAARERLERLVTRSTPPPEDGPPTPKVKDPRREPEADPRRETDSSIPPDVVDVEHIPERKP